jgi:long-chain acyl-CoA synthetase
VDKFGWFDTGDLGQINPATGDLILMDRAKDTIVLSNGETIEPLPLEDAILGGSPMIEQVMLTGQDRRRLVAILVVNPKEVCEEGFLKTKEGAKLLTEYEKVNDPECTEEDCEAASNVLNKVFKKLWGTRTL